MCDRGVRTSGNELLRRMTLAHEVGHILSGKMFGTSLAGFNHNHETQSKMTTEDMMKFLRVSETRADSFAISLLLLPWIVGGEAMKKFHNGYRIRKFGKSLVLPEDMISINKIAESLHVTYDDAFWRLDYKGGFVDYPHSEYNRIMGIGGLNETVR